MKEWFDKQKVIPVIMLENADDALWLAEALEKEGMFCIEIACRTPAAFEGIEKIAKAYKNMKVLAGTILDPEQAKAAFDAGAAGVVSPGLNPETIKWCNEKKFNIIPGCMTPSEIEVAMRRGLEIVKIFPARALGGAPYIRALQGPYPKMNFIPSGGVDAMSTFEYLDIPQVIACSGSWVVTRESVQYKDPGTIQKRAREALRII